MRKRDGIGGCVVLLVLIAVIVLVMGVLVLGFTAVVTRDMPH
jgi:hypothetical protein